jgi:cytochrome c oxidase cbb3-type subunit IV
MDTSMVGLVAGISTVVSMTLFIVVVIWALSRQRQRDFDDAARLPLEEDQTGAQS